MPGPAGAASSASLDDVFEALRARYFADDDRGLDAICTRVMLRTGADLRAPRAHQRTDPTVISEVLTALMVMGYAPRTPTPDRSPPEPSRPAAPPDHRAREPRVQPSRARRWLHPFRRRDGR
jgi:hypothetical protein